MKTVLNQANYLAGNVKTAGARSGSLPAHVRLKMAKGRAYYYFETGRKDERGAAQEQP